MQDRMEGEEDRAGVTNRLRKNIRTDRWMVRWTDVQKDRQMEGQIDRQTN